MLGKGRKWNHINIRLKDKVRKTKMGIKNKGNKYKIVANMVGVNLVILILNINGLNIIIRRVL